MSIIRNGNAWLVALAAAAAVAGCSGSEGAQGPKGDPGTPGAQGAPGQPGENGQPGVMPATAESCALCHAAGATGTILVSPTAAHNAKSAPQLAKGSITITKATIPTSGVVQPVIEFTVANAAGQPVTGWTSFYFFVEKQRPADDTHPVSWQEYLWATSSGVNSPNREATTDTSTNTNYKYGTLAELGSGAYRYTFATDINAVTTPVAVTFDPAAIHRFGIQMAASLSSPSRTYDSANGFADFLPGTDTPQTLSHEIVTTVGCNACHGKLAVHGGGRVEPGLCVQCHNRALGEANPANAAGDFLMLVHGIHSGENYPVAGGYVFPPASGTRAATSWGDVTFPQDLRHCDTCHKGAQGSNWQTQVTAYACKSCHADMTFSDEVGPNDTASHSFAATTDPTSLCLACHGAGRPQDVVKVHSIVTETAAAKFQYRIDSIASTSPGQMPVVTFRVIDPTTPAGCDPTAITAGTTTPCTPYNIKTDAPFTQGSNSSLSVDLAWSNTDIQNVGGNQAYGQVVRINALTAATAGSNGQFVATSTVPVPTDATGSGTAAIEGHPAVVSGTTTYRVAAPSVTKAFKIAGSGGTTARRSVVDIDKCNKCHAVLSLHGNNRTPTAGTDTTLCAMCHNPEATDGAQRPADGSLGVDGKVQQAIDLKVMIHGIHAAKIVVYGYGKSVNDFRDVTFPNILSNCEACHKAGTYGGPVATANGTTTFSGTDTVGGADNLRTTKWTAVCSSCHSSGVGMSHMIQQGAGFGLTEAQIDSLNQ